MVMTFHRLKRLINQWLSMLPNATRSDVATFQFRIGSSPKTVAVLPLVFFRFFSFSFHFMQFTGVAAPSIYAGSRQAVMRNVNEIKCLLTALGT
ncbi:hypothetical protein [Cupriavidus sp. AcVe19-1a]|uniref:hypothetical protein n=1 Tax=Cupriavidus sp. AcVe19-1a TaxID=2821359 RepID=UPI001AE1ABB0|nr:hypothetical protein [Cupriavidus sp. AcVe19-1a]MBP0633455.1 hypothetical protein [Cupriavidus sp. AcVe19-1a]